MEKFKVAATGVSLNYMPEYLAHEQGFFTELEIVVENEAPDPWTVGLQQLDNHQADVVLGGIWVPIMYRSHVKDYVSLAKIASKCPLMILAREPIVSPFNWQMLENKRVLISGGDGASHYLIALGSARDGGADVDKIRFIHDFSTSMIKELFAGGFGDYIVLQPDVAQVFIKRGIGHLFCELATEGPTIPWSVYYALPLRLEQRREVFNRFFMGLQKGTTYLLENGGVACREILKSKWPELNVEEGIKTIDLFIKHNMWSESVQITRSELARWQDYLIVGDMLDQAIDYEKLVDSGPFRESQRQIEGGMAK